MTTRSSEGSDLDTLLENINCLIQDKLPKRLQPQYLESSGLDSLTKQLEEYEIFLVEIRHLLDSKEIMNHQLLWLESLGYLADLLLKLKQCFAKLYLHIPFYEIEPVFERAINLNTKLVSFTNEFGEVFSTWLVSTGCSLQLYSNVEINQRLLFLLYNSMELLVVDEMEEDQQATNSYLSSIQDFLVRYTVWCIQENKPSIDTLPILTQFSKTIYLFGESVLILPLINLFDPEIPINIISQNYSINLVDVLNFYRYTAFNLITISLTIQPPEIIDSYNKLADIYLKILLNFPNLNLNSYAEIRLESDILSRRFQPRTGSGGVHDKREDFIVNVPERQELSLMYILNSLLSLTSLTKFIDPPPLYKQELSFLCKSLSNSLSKDIDELASQPTSTHSSVISFPQLNQLENEKSLEYMQRKIINKTKFKNISSVILHGSYKEKLSNVVKLCNLLNDSGLTVPALCSKYHSITSRSENGPLRTAVESVLKLLILLSLKYMDSVNSISVENLKKLFFIDGSIEDVFKVKHLVNYEIVVENGEQVLKLQTSKNVKSINLIVNDQLEISRLSQKLKELVA